MIIDEFVDKMKPKASKGLLEVSGMGKLSKKTWTLSNGRAEIMVIRGGAIEKAAITHMILQGFTPLGITEKFDAEVYQMEVFPENPYCPMGHFNTEWLKNGPNRYYMNLDVFPAVRVEEDLKAMKDAMDIVADRFGIDREKMRVRGTDVFEALDTHYTMEHFIAPLAAKVGCKLRELKDEDLDLFITAYETFLGVYLDIISKRKDTSYTEGEMQLKLERNGKWLEYLQFKDRAVKATREQGTTHPEVQVEMFWPPSAIF